MNKLVQCQRKVIRVLIYKGLQGLIFHLGMIMDHGRIVTPYLDTINSPRIIDESVPWIPEFGKQN